MAQQQRAPSRFGFSWFSALRSAPQPRPSRPNEGSAPVQGMPSQPAQKAKTPPPTSQSQVQQKSGISAGRAPVDKVPTQPPARQSQAQQKNETAAGKAQVQPSPSHSQATQESEYQTPLTSPTSQTKETSKPSSQSHSATQPEVADSVPSSPQHRAFQSQQSAGEGQTPSRLAFELSEQNKAPSYSSPHHTNDQPRKTHEAVPELPSPLKMAKSPTEESSVSSARFSQPSRATSQEPAAELQEISQKAKPTVKTTSQEEKNPLTSHRDPRELKPKTAFKVKPAISSGKDEEVNQSGYQHPAQKLNSKEEFKVEPTNSLRKQEEGNPLTSQRSSQELNLMAVSKANPASTFKKLNLVETSSQTDSATGKLTQVPSPFREEPTESQKLDPKTTKGEKLTSKLESELQKTEDRGKVVLKNMKEEAKSIIQDNQGQTRKTVTQPLISDKEKKINSSKRLSSTSSHTEGMHIVHARTHQRPQAADVRKAPFHKELGKDIPERIPKLATGSITELLMNEKPVGATTVAEGNKGAIMHVDSSSKKDGLIHARPRYKRRVEEGPKATAIGGGSEGKKSKYQYAEEDSLSNAYINSNVQSINSSFLLGSSVNERNPGVHIASSLKKAENIKRMQEKATYGTKR